MKKTLWRKRRFLSIGIIIAALSAGALVRASHHGSFLSAERPQVQTLRVQDVTYTHKDHNLSAEAEILPPESGVSSDEMGEGAVSGFSSARKASSGKKLSKPREVPDLKLITKDVHPIDRPPGDMKEYLDEAEKVRRERIKRSLKEVQKKVKGWQKSIFDPTW